MTLLIRERPRLALALDIAIPQSNHARWAPDEHTPANVPSNLTFSSTMPGGFEQMSCVLARQAGNDYPDLAEFATVTVSGPGGQVAWQGRLETTPRTSGDQLSITPGAVGWQAALDDNQSARMIYVDRDLTQWQSASATRQAVLAATTTYGADADPQVAADISGGVPALILQHADVWALHHQPIAEAVYRATVPLDKVYYSVSLATGSSVSTGDANWTWQAMFWSDDRGDGSTLTEGTGNLRTITPHAAYVNSPSNYQFAVLQFFYADVAGGASNINYSTTWQNLAVYGDHGLTLQGTDPGGVLASDVVQHAVQTWAPVLATSRGGVSTIETSTFVIPHLVFTDPTTASNIIKGATQFGLPDWWVDEGPTFNLASRDNHGKRWRARVGPSGLQETGPQVDRLFNSVIVSYSDVTGITRTVGPTGSGADTIDDSLTDTDPSNPVNVAGLTRRSVLAMGITSTPAAASQVGQDWLAEQKLLSTAGQAQIVGHIEDDHGVLWPAWMIRAGDQISFTDAHDPVYRRVVRAEYSDSSKANQLDLDSPPEGLSALLSRLSVSLTPLGLS